MKKPVQLRAYATAASLFTPTVSPLAPAWVLEWQCFPSALVFLSSPAFLLPYGCMFTCSVTKSCPTPCDRTDCNLPDSSVCGIFWARILEWVAVFSSRGSSRSRDQTCVSCVGRRVLCHCDTSEAMSYLPSCLFHQEDPGSAFSPLHSVGGNRAKRLRGQISESVRTRVKS